VWQILDFSEFVKQSFAQLLYLTLMEYGRHS